MIPDGEPEWDGTNRGFFHDWIDYAVSHLRQYGGWGKSKAWWNEIQDVPEWLAKLLDWPDSAHRGEGSKTRAYVYGHALFLAYLPRFLRWRKTVG